MTRGKSPTWYEDGWFHLRSTTQRNMTSLLYHCTAEFGLKTIPWNGNFARTQSISFILPADMIEQDRRDSGRRFYDCPPTMYRAIREIHLSRLDPCTFEGRELPTISLEDARR